MKTLGIDPGTVTIDVCGLDDGEVFLDRALPTDEVAREPEALVEILRQAGAELIAGPSGYGVPLVRVEDVSEEMLRIAFLARPGEGGGIMGMRSLVRALAEAELPVVLTPGVVQLPSVPEHRKINRVDMGTADKLCAAALGVHSQMLRRECAASEVSFILLELGGAFTAGIAVSGGMVVDGVGGTSGPIGGRSAGALDGEVAFLAGEVPKSLIFKGGIATIVGEDSGIWTRLDDRTDRRARIARAAFIEGAEKTVAALAVSVPRPYEILLSGRAARVSSIERELDERLARYAPVGHLVGSAQVAKQAAEGAALIANGLAGGQCTELVATLGVRDASGSVLDHLYIITAEQARERLGLR
ncbi:MAG TPA: DUF1464 family protein [Gemmatimonadaceae bacterium]|nr:DUF1464 family protein [Gemmatimonadaceae bacterium]